jgi:hypothetical protein
MPSRSQPRRIEASIASQMCARRARTSATGATAASLRSMIVEIDSPCSSAMARSSAPVENGCGTATGGGA